MRQSPETPHTIRHLASGFLMGGADIIPGVSGGTVALILGIYRRLVTAISRFDLTFLRFLRQGQWSQAASHMDLRFLFTLGSGIAIGIVSLASLMHYLLAHHRQYTLSAFFGLILASSVLVALMIRVQGGRTLGIRIVSGLLAGLFAYWLVGQGVLTPRPGYGYLFFCGAIAICAMILPGISGAFLLLVLGKYADITGTIRQMAHLQGTLQDLLTLAVFAAGCLFGLLSFSKMLRWLLDQHQSITMAVLCGLMVGSLRKIWPFQTDLTPHLPLKEKQYINHWPALDDAFWISVAIAATAMMAVFLVDRIASPLVDSMSPSTGNNGTSDDATGQGRPQ